MSSDGWARASSPRTNGTPWASSAGRTSSRRVTWVCRRPPASRVRPLAPLALRSGPPPRLRLRRTQWRRPRLASPVGRPGFRRLGGRRIGGGDRAFLQRGCFSERSCRGVAARRPRERPREREWEWWGGCHRGRGDHRVPGRHDEGGLQRERRLTVVRRVRLDHGPQRQLLQVPQLRLHERVQLSRVTDKVTQEARILHRGLTVHRRRGTLYARRWREAR